ALTGNPRTPGTLNGAFDMSGSMPGLFDAGFRLDVSTLRGSLSLASSRIDTVDVGRASLAGEIDTGLATLTSFQASTSIGEVSGKGKIAISREDSHFTYEANITDASRLAEFTPIPLRGEGTVKGRAVGPL